MWLMSYQAPEDYELLLFSSLLTDLHSWLPLLSADKKIKENNILKRFRYFIKHSVSPSHSQTHELKSRTKLLRHFSKYVTKLKCYSVRYITEAFRLHSQSMLTKTINCELRDVYWLLKAKAVKMPVVCKDNVRTSKYNVINNIQHSQSWLIQPVKDSARTNSTTGVVTKFNVIKQN